MKSEKAIQNEILLALSQSGCKVFRTNAEGGQNAYPTFWRLWHKDEYLKNYIAKDDVTNRYPMH